jgi:hypothetical protein
MLGEVDHKRDTRVVIHLLGLPLHLPSVTILAHPPPDSALRAYLPISTLNRYAVLTIAAPALASNAGLSLDSLCIYVFIVCTHVPIYFLTTRMQLLPLVVLVHCQGF